MEDDYPYTGYEPSYTGAPTTPDSASQEYSSCASKDKENTDMMTPAVTFDPRRLAEMEITDGNLHGSSSYGAAAGYLQPKVAYLHDRRRISVHPLGPVERPLGVSKHFWDRFDDDIVISPYGEEEAGVLKKSGVAGTEVIKKRAIEVPKPRHITTGGGSDGSPPPSQPEEEHDPSEMPFLDHLEELRWAILKSIIVIVLAMVASWYLSDWFYNQITGLAKGGKSFLGNTNSVNIALPPLGRHPGKVTGTIIDLKTKKPIPYASVTLNPGGYSTRTDSLGRYVIEGVPEGSYTVTATKEGYSANTRSSGMKLVMTTVMEPLIIRLQIALVMGLVLALPLVFFFIWSFISPGLYQNEKQWVLPLIFASVGCFFVGAALAWFVIVPYMLKFLQTFMPPDVDGMFTFGKFLGIILKFTLSFGIIFELPMVSFVLAKIGILKHQFMSKYRGYALVLVFVVSAIITPTVDPVSQTLMAIPLYLLYEVSILVARFAGRKTLI